MENTVSLVLAALLAVLITRLWTAFMQLIWRPRSINKMFKAQGIDGPGYKFFVGSMGDFKAMMTEAQKLVLDVHDHDIIPRVQPRIRKWQGQYGKTYVYWAGTNPSLLIGDVNLVKQVLSERTGLYPKNYRNPGLRALLGKGLVITDGEIWQRHRKVVHPAFNMESLKTMAKIMSECATSKMQTWEAQVRESESRQVEIELSKHFQELTADVISRTAFGSSYEEGREVFRAQKQLEELTFAAMFDVQFPGSKHLPTERNRQLWSLDKKVKSMLMDVIKTRLASKEKSGYGNDLLGFMLESSSPGHEGGQSLTMDEIIDECKTFFFAGQDTTSHLLTWTMFLLSTHPEWQEKLREEVLRECGKEIPHGDMLNALKLVNMVILESLRLYSPVTFIDRKASTDMEIGHIKVPKGTGLSMPIATLHRDKEVWGEDAYEFKPMRFENGISKASKIPNALIAFSQGPRACIGQNFAMIEAKIVIAMILQKFSFSLSPKYVHAPMNIVTLVPKFGLPMLLRSLDG